MNSITYCGFTARIDLDDRDGLFAGPVLGLIGTVRIIPPRCMVPHWWPRGHGISLNQWAGRMLRFVVFQAPRDAIAAVC